MKKILLGSSLWLSCMLTSTASAQVVNGQSYSKRGLHCGGQIRVTEVTGIGPVSASQYSWIYYNCSDTTVRRKVDIAAALDGKCYGIGPGKARVLHNMWDPTIGHINQFRGSKPC